MKIDVEADKSRKTWVATNVGGVFVCMCVYVCVCVCVGGGMGGGIRGLDGGSPPHNTKQTSLRTLLDMNRMIWWLQSHE